MIDEIQTLKNEVEKDNYYEAGYNKGLNDAWELIRKVFSLNRTERKKAFGCEEIRTVVDCFNVKEVLNMLEAYEEEQAQIKVGDVVEYMDSGKKFLVITEETRGYYDFGVIDLDIMELGRIYNKPKLFKKTGKHIDIQNILKQIKE